MPSALELPDRLIEVELASASDGCSLVSPADTSRWSGDECMGELDFLLVVSLPPREEFRGETLPVCSYSSNVSLRDHAITRENKEKIFSKKI